MFLSWQYQKYPRRSKPSSSQGISPKHVDLAWASSFKNINKKILKDIPKIFKNINSLSIGMDWDFLLNVNILRNINMLVLVWLGLD